MMLRIVLTHPLKALFGVLGVIGLLASILTASPAQAMIMLEPPPIVSIATNQPAASSQLRAITLAETTAWSEPSMLLGFEYGLVASNALAVEPTGQIVTSVPGGIVVDTTAYDPALDWYILARLTTTRYGVDYPYTTEWSHPFLIAGPDYVAPEGTIFGSEPTPSPEPSTPEPPAPTPSETVTTLPATPQPLNWVALGDSYSSGEGVEPFIDGTDVKGNHCHRSQLAYAEDVVSANPGKYRLSFHACSGAVFDDLYKPNHDNKLESTPQYDWIKPDTDIVTITIGGNDAHFADVMKYCATRTATQTTCEKKWSAKVEHAIDKLGNATGNKYAVMVENIRDRAPNARIYLLGYPRFFPVNPPKNCPTGALNFQFSRSDMRWINEKIKQLDELIHRGAEWEGYAQYVDTYDLYGGSHDLCGRDPWINRAITLPVQNRPYSYHPNKLGHQAEARLLEDLMG